MMLAGQNGGADLSDKLHRQHYNFAHNKINNVIKVAKGMSNADQC